MSQCLVISRGSLEKMPFWGRFEKTNDLLDSALFLESQEIKELLELIKKEGVFKERKGEDGVETQPEWQQVIFYALVVKGNTFFVYKRGGTDSSSGEERLHSKLSAGVGGHIEPFDNSLIDSLYRELDEELAFSKEGKEIPFAGDVNVLGVIKLDIGEVNTVHLGLACLVRISDRKISVGLKGDENSEGWFTTLSEYNELIDSGKYSPEGWTTLLMTKIAPKVLN